jgi:hypothetical protein
LQITQSPASALEDPFNLTMEDVVPASLQKPARGILDGILQKMNNCANHPAGSFGKSCTNCRHAYWSRKLQKEKVN